MCTTIAQKAPIFGSGKGPQGWFDLAEVYVGYDHPFHAPLDHALSLDFVNEAQGSRVAVELSRESARDLAHRILAALAQADVYEGTEDTGDTEAPSPPRPNPRTVPDARTVRP